MDEKTATSQAQRERDTRLAWIIVGTCGAVTAILAVLLGTALLRQAYRSVEAGMRQAAADSARLRQVAANADRPAPPPNSAQPLGSPGDWVRTDDYPKTALRAGEQGRVRITLAIDPAGKPTGCSVALSSGSWSLDNGTCLAMMRRGRFDAAQPGSPDSRPGAVRRWTSPPIRWVLPD